MYIVRSGRIGRIGKMIQMMKRTDLKYLGKVPLCNHRPERGIYIHGFCLPLCARCTGILIGAVGGMLVILGLTHSNLIASFPGARLMTPVINRVLVGAFMLIPTAVDGGLQYVLGKESTNRRRLITGFLAGMGCAIIESGIVSLIF